MFRLAAFAIFVIPVFAHQVAIVAEGEVGLPARHGLAKLEQSLRTLGVSVSDSGAPDAYVVASLKAGGKPESLSIRRGTHNQKPAILISGSDTRGLMYAALDTAERVSWATATKPFAAVRDTNETPYIGERGVSMYTMQRAYFESRLYDEEQWRRYFDMLASARINSFVVIFGYENGGFMAALYPYFFNVQGYPDVELVGITTEQQAKNTAAFKAMIRIAHERGIDVTAAIWDHIYRGGVQGGGISGANDTVGKRVPGLVSGVTADNLGAYTKAALQRFLDVFPEVDAIQFRMHDESGLKHEEMPRFWHEVFSLIKQTHPTLRLDLRAKELPDEVIDDALAQGLQARISTKYWMEQMGLPFHPTHINTQNQMDRRHGYADLLRYPKRYKIHWQLWSGGTTRLLLWGDPDYVRRFAGSVKLYDGDSFEINEMLATKMLGEPHDERPLDVLNPRYRYFDYEFERYWNFYRLWGRLTYNPQTAPEVWEHEFSHRFGPQVGPNVMKAEQIASGVLPRIVASSYRYQNFPTTRGWAEMNRQGSLREYATEDGSDIQQFMNVRDEAKSLRDNTDTAMRRPEENSRWFAETANAILAEVAMAEKAGGTGNEFRSTVTDARILAGLARYHSWRLLAGVAYNLGDFDDAIEKERKALQSWSQIVEAAGDVYSENLAFGVHRVGFARHWKEEYQLLQRDFDQLVKDRKPGTAATKHAPTGAAPVAKLLPARDLTVSAKVTAPDGVKWVRLRYRHLTQFEDYQTAEMTLDPKTATYTASIPRSFVDPKWDIVYFVEAVGKNGVGRMYPDLERETPYVVLPVKR